MWTRKFWADALERAISTMAQFLVVLGGADGTGFLNMQWEQLLTLTLLGGVATIIKALASSGIGNKESAAVIDTEAMG